MDIVDRLKSTYNMNESCELAIIEIESIRNQLAECQKDAERYKRQRDELGCHVVPVYEALDALFDNAQEIEVDDVLGKWVSNDLWHELENVLDADKAIDQAMSEKG